MKIQITEAQADIIKSVATLPKDIQQNLLRAWSRVRTIKKEGKLYLKLSSKKQILSQAVRQEFDEVYKLIKDLRNESSK